MTAPLAVASLWGGRFREVPASAMERLNRSLPVDHRLWREDVAGSRAWVSALEGAGVLSAAEASELGAGLAAVADRLAGWSVTDWTEAPDEDIHTLVERLLRDEVGELAGKLATGRSRNDQVATSLRLWAMGAVKTLDSQIQGLQAALVSQADQHVDTLMPSYTHLQRAQPVTGGHWLLSHVWPLVRDRERLASAAARLDRLPLGSGAVAGCPYAVDRLALAEALGMTGVSENSMDAVGDRDFVAELLFVMAMVGTHLSRLAEDVIVFASQEFGFVRLPDRYSTGSSLMPQKRNPDALELSRANAGRALGELVGWLATLKGLPSAYNKDLQEDKAVLFAGFDALDRVLPAVTGTIGEMSLDAAACARAVDSAMLATDLADAWVAGGLPFRDAHERVGRLVRTAEETGAPLHDCLSDTAGADDGGLAAADARAALDPARSVARRSAAGGTAPVAVRAQLEEARKRSGPAPFR